MVTGPPLSAIQVPLVRRSPGTHENHAHALTVPEHRGAHSGLSRDRASGRLGEGVLRRCDSGARHSSFGLSQHPWNVCDAPGVPEPSGGGGLVAGPGHLQDDLTNGARRVQESCRDQQSRHRGLSCRDAVDDLPEHRQSVSGVNAGAVVRQMELSYLEVEP